MMLATSSSGRQRSHSGEHASEKRSLASILRDHGPIPVTDAIDIALDVCDELASAHANGIVHGDLGMHRVRTHWPRVRGQRVEIFALGENDSAAFTFRASAALGLVAPEQRENRPVDTRADVWAVGAMLHWMIAGVAPGADPVEKTLAKAPRAVAGTVEACLATDPARRPQSVDQLSEAIASFASSPPERFEQLARRRSTYENAKRVRTDLGDVERVLGRLDDAALQRELAAVSSETSQVGPLDRLALAVHKTTGSTIFEKSVPMIDLADLADDEENVETVLAHPRYGAEEVDEALPSIASPLSIAPVVLSSELLGPPKEPDVPATPVVTAPMVMAPASAVHVAVRPRTKPWTMALGIAGAVAALALGVGIGMRMVERAMASNTAPSAEAPARAPDVVATSAAAPAKAAAKPEPASAAPAQVAAKSEPATSASAPVAAPAMPAVVTPHSLPDARPAASASPPAVALATPDSLPDAKPARASAPSAPPKASTSAAPTTREDEATSTTEVAPTSLSDALR